MGNGPSSNAKVLDRNEALEARSKDLARIINVINEIEARSKDEAHSKDGNDRIEALEQRNKVSP